MDDDEKKTDGTGTETPPVWGPMKWGEMAGAGDVEGLVASYEAEVSSAAAMGGPVPSNLNTPERFLVCMHRALHVLGQRSPAKLSAVVLTQVLIVQGHLHERARVHIEERLRQWDSERRATCRPVPPDIETEWLPRLSRIQREIKDTASALASAARQHELAAQRARERVRSCDPFQPAAQQDDVLGGAWVHGSDSAALVADGPHITLVDTPDSTVPHPDHSELAGAVA